MGCRAVAAGCIAAAATPALRRSRQRRRARNFQADKPKQAEPAKPAVAAELQQRAKPDLFDIKDAQKDFVLCIVGNMRPLVRNENGVSFQSRFGFLYKDGSVRIYRRDGQEPVAPALRHSGPIREFAFIEQHGLVLTSSDDSVKVWNGLSGEFRKELSGQFIRPLAFTSISTCAEPGPEPLHFVTIDVAGRVITSWDAATLEPAGAFEPEGTAKLLGAGRTRDGKLLATIAGDHSVTIWSASSKKPLATFFEPLTMAKRCFAEDLNWLKGPRLRLNDEFWQAAAPLLPAKF